MARPALTLFLGTLALLVAAPAFGDTPVEAHLEANGVTILKRFDGPSGMTGIVAEAAGGQRRVMYVTADGQTLVHGTLFDARGGNLTERHARDVSQQLPAVRSGMDAAKREAMFRTLSGLQGIEQGRSDAARTIYAIIDPQCPHCHTLGDQLQPAIESGRVRVVWLPAAVLSRESEAQAGAMYQLPANRAVSDWLADKLPTTGAVSDDVREHLARNVLALRDTGHGAVPFVVSRTRDGRDVLVSVGAPSPAELRNFTE